jgi:predicted nucleic-acid-binding Zn-ribbon protein
MKNCKCGNNEFFTTKTVHHELTVTNVDGNLVDGDTWVESDHQPYPQYFHFVCSKCGEVYSANQLL